MDEQDYKYLISSYQQKGFDLMSQLVATEARVKKLTDIVDTLNKQIIEQQKEIDKLNKIKKTTKDEFS
jgi:uncharacterized protein YdcH (DUF465 family)